SAPAVATLTDAAGQPTVYTLDDFGRRTRLQTPDGADQYWERDAAGQVTLYTDALGRPTTYYYDYGAGRGDLVGVIYPDGNPEAYGYDPTFHHLTQKWDSLGRVTTSDYDPATGDRLSTTDPMGQVTMYVWSNGLLQSETDAAGYPTFYEYD